MKSTVRLTKQGIPDLNYYGPRRTPVAPVVEVAPTLVEEVVSPAGEAVKAAEAPDTEK
jgi:hypothetical protein